MEKGIALFNYFGISQTDNFKYSEQSNSFINNGYTSMAGNTYFNEFRFGEGILIKKDIGEGYKWTFLNRIMIYDLRTKVLLCERDYTNERYNALTVKLEAKDMLCDLLISSAQKEGLTLNIIDVKHKIDQIVEYAFENNQLNAINEQTMLYLNQ